MDKTQRKKRRQVQQKVGKTLVGLECLTKMNKQVEALKSLSRITEETEATKDSREENESDHQEEEEEDDDDENVDENEEDEGIEVVLARCLRNAETSSDRRRSSRVSTYRDSHLARLLHDQAVDEILEQFIKIQALQNFCSGPTISKKM